VAIAAAGWESIEIQLSASAAPGLTEDYLVPLHCLRQNPLEKPSRIVVAFETRYRQTPETLLGASGLSVA